MAECDACRELIGKPENAERHAGLAAFTSRKLAQGWHEMYMCRACGTRLLRVVMEPGSPSAGKPWSKAG
jgi:hypothetical protein